MPSHSKHEAAMSERASVGEFADFGWETPVRSEHYLHILDRIHPYPRCEKRCNRLISHDSRQAFVAFGYGTYTLPLHVACSLIVSVTSDAAS